MGRSVGRRTPRNRDVSLFNFEEDLGHFDDPLVEDIEGRPRRKKRKVKDGQDNNGDILDPDLASTTRDLTTVAIALPVVGLGFGVFGTL